MLSVEVVTRENAGLHRALLDEHYRRRAEIFVTEKKWRDLEIVNGTERDQFDTAATTYLLLVDDGQLVGGCRLHPSTEPTLLSEVFPHLASVRGFERSPDIFEMTRGFVIRSRREERPMRCGGALKAAILEYCQAEGIRSVNGVCETWFVPGLRQLGWPVRFLGLPQREGEYDLVAFNAAVTDEALSLTREHYGLPAPITSWRGIVHQPAGRPTAIVRV